MSSKLTPFAAVSAPIRTYVLIQSRASDLSNSWILSVLKMPETAVSVTVSTAPIGNHFYTSQN